jgi:hypothetical protein
VGYLGELGPKSNWAARKIENGLEIFGYRFEFKIKV